MSDVEKDNEISELDLLVNRYDATMLELQDILTDIHRVIGGSDKDRNIIEILEAPVDFLKILFKDIRQKIWDEKVRKSNEEIPVKV